MHWPELERANWKQMAIFEYIEGFYNRQRRHSYLGYLSLEDFEKKNAA